MIAKVTNFISCIWESSELALDGSYSEAASSVWSVDSPSLDRSTTGTGGGSGGFGAGKSSLPLNWTPMLRIRGWRLTCVPENKITIVNLPFLTIHIFHVRNTLKNEQVDF